MADTLERGAIIGVDHIRLHAYRDILPRLTQHSGQVGRAGPMRHEAMLMTAKNWSDMYKQSFVDDALEHLTEQWQE